jgi:hypothetical protein
MPNQQLLDNLKTALDSEGSISKAQLGEILEIGSRNTIRDTLRACGLDSKKERYTSDEIWNNFIPAREMIEAGKRYGDVAEHFGIKDCGGASVDASDADSDSFGHENGARLTDTVEIAVAESTYDVVQNSVKQVSQYVPKLVVHSLKEELNSQQMKEAIRSEMRSQLDSEKSDGNGAGAAFLLQKMKRATHQIEGTTEQPLLEASGENSQENSNEYSAS